MYLTSYRRQSGTGGDGDGAVRAPTNGDRTGRDRVGR